MKTIKITLLLTASFFIMMGSFANNMDFVVEKESYIKDIPFSTSEVSANCMYEMALKKEFNLEEESYINDIPFNTEEIASECIYENALNETFNLPEEKAVHNILLIT